MKCKKQIIQTSLLAFGLSMGVGTTSVLAAPPTKSNFIESISQEELNNLDHNIDVYIEMFNVLENHFVMKKFSLKEVEEVRNSALKESEENKKEYINKVIDDFIKKYQITETVKNWVTSTTGIKNTWLKSKQFQLELKQLVEKRNKDAYDKTMELLERTFRESDVSIKEIEKQFNMGLSDVNNKYIKNTMSKALKDFISQYDTKHSIPSNQ